MTTDRNLLEVDDLAVELTSRSRSVPVLDSVRFSVRASERVGLIGESGCGKSTTALAIMGLVPSGGRVVRGHVRLDGRDLPTADERTMQSVRGREIAMVFQDPRAALDPAHTIGQQIAEVARHHLGLTRRAARTRAVDLLARVGIPDAARRADDHPHRLSGGMRQRAQLAIALAGEPRLLIADEPTTSLDVTVQAQVLDLLVGLCEELRMALLLLTHDLAVVAEACNRVEVMHRGAIVESGAVTDVFAQPSHPGTISLLRQRPGARSPAVLASTTTPDEGATPAALLTVRGLTKAFPVSRTALVRRRGRVHAVDDVSFEIAPGETLGLVGESGAGKSTVGRLVLRLIEPDAGTVHLDEVELTALRRRELHAHRSRMHMVFQDPTASLDPMWPVSRIVAEPLVARGGGTRADRDARVADLLSQVGLDPHDAHRFPHEFSGGQCQRIAIARSLALRPDLIVCDEPVSSLDVATQTKVLRLLHEQQDAVGVACLFIGHDLTVLREVSHRVAVMHVGRIVEIGPVDEVFARPRHPYTQALLSAVPRIDASARSARIVLEGELASPIEPPSGCRFHTRCPHAMEVCTRVEPPTEQFDDVTVACHLHRDGPALAGETVQSIR